MFFTDFYSNKMAIFVADLAKLRTNNLLLPHEI